MEIVVLIIGFIICYFVAALVHELGHVVCGLLHRWKLYMLVVGPVKVYRETLDSKIKVGIEKNITLWGGAGGTFPTKKSKENVGIWGRVLLAGPLTSIVFGLAMIPFFVFTKNIFVLMLVLMPLAMGLMCLIPTKLKTGILYVDGMRYKRIKSGGQEAREEKAIFELTEIDMIDGENSFYPAEAIKPLLDSKDNEFKYIGYYCSYKNAEKNGNAKEAKEWVQNMKGIRNKVPKTIVDSYKV